MASTSLPTLLSVNLPYKHDIAVNTTINVLNAKIHSYYGAGLSLLAIQFENTAFKRQIFTTLMKLASQWVWQAPYALLHHQIDEASLLNYSQVIGNGLQQLRLLMQVDGVYLQWLSSRARSTSQLGSK